MIGALILAASTVAFAARSLAARDAPPVALRADQVGYLPSDPKIAYLMATRALRGESYRVLNGSAAVVASGPVTTASRGSWNSRYRYVYPISFSGLAKPGAYHVVASGSVSASSDAFRVESAAALYRPLVLDGVHFFRNQRDGADVVPGPLRREPSHLHDSAASVYARPTFRSRGSDVIAGTLKRLGGPVAVEGGWFDAGDYLKFTFTTSYADDLLYAAARALGGRAPASLTDEARYGTRWLNEIWMRNRKVLYSQVGIGSGNEKTFFGDHDLWRLPQADDPETGAKDHFAAAHRPVFEAAPPGHKIDPDVAGRVAAAFAFAAQAEAKRSHAQAAKELRNAVSLYAMASKHPPRELASTLPRSYYPETIWHDAMELAATEIVLAELDLHLPRLRYIPYLRQAATWASEYISSDSGKDTLNLYDVSALAHADLVSAIRRAGLRIALAVSPARLIANLGAQLHSAARRASGDVFHAGGAYTDFDVDSHMFGFVATEALYRKLSGSGAYRAFAAEQLQWLLGANPWGMSFMVGVGKTFPHCMQSQIPNLAGSLTGRRPIDTGAVVNGPNGASNFKGGLGGPQPGMRRCENDGGIAFTGHGSEYLDDVRAWQTDEPALDMTGSAILAGALQSAP